MSDGTTKKFPLVTVVIPTYNRCNQITEALQSVLDQTYRNLQILIVDDGSEDNTESIVKKITDNRIEYIRIKHSGAAFARNVGVNRAKGEYIAFLDSDDVFLQDKIGLQLQSMLKSPEIPLCHTSYFLENFTRKQTNVIHSGVFTGSVFPSILASCPIATPTVMLRTKFISSAPFVNEVAVGEDVLLWSSIAKGSRILGIDKALTKVRIRSKSASLNPNNHINVNFLLLKYFVTEDTAINAQERKKRLYYLLKNRSAIYSQMHKPLKAFICNIIAAYYRFITPLFHTERYGTYHTS